MSGEQEKKKEDSKQSCPIEFTLKVIGGKWKTRILWFLHDKVKRFGELRKLIPDITQKMLTQQLRELEKDGLINRKAYPVVPPKVEYSMSLKGKSLQPILNSICKWGLENLEKASRSQC
jgi:DNA-binding HxlR family transcriptional regulator